MQKNCTTGKQLALKGRFVFSTQEVLRIAREAEKAIADKTSHKQCCNSSIIVKLGGDEENTLEIVPSDSESECITVVQCR
jgi:hypothetical protein